MPSGFAQVGTVPFNSLSINDTLLPTWFKHHFDAYITAVLDTVTVTGSDPGDTEPPTLQAAVVEHATPNEIQLTYSEPVVMTTAGFELTGVASTAALTGFANNGTANVTVQLDDNVAFNDVPLLSYNQSNGNTLDTADNELVAFVDFAITNNVQEPVATMPDSIQYRVAATAGFNHIIYMTGVTSGGTVRVGWGDGEFSSLTLSGAETSVSHVYTNAGQYDVSYTGALNNIRDLELNDQRIDSLYPGFGKNMDLRSGYQMLMGNNFFTSLNDSFGYDWDLITNIGQMFYNSQLRRLNDLFGVTWTQINLAGSFARNAPLEQLNDNFGINWQLLTTADQMLNACNLTALPDSFGARWPLLTTASSMLYNNHLTTVNDSFFN
ncbi:MAG: copper resistance protein CopC [Bacteroidales bacterium]|nr:copper resistance protein CopC [Bacteroidales bacterium]